MRAILRPGCAHMNSTPRWFVPIAMCGVLRGANRNSSNWSKPSAHLQPYRLRPDQHSDIQGYLMKLLSFVVDGRPSYGALKDHGVVDLGARFTIEGCTTLRQLLEANRLADAARLV